MGMIDWNDWHSWFPHSAALTAVLADTLAGIAKKSPPYLFAPYWRLWKETLLVRNLTRSERFESWKPKSDHYVALRAIKAKVAHRDEPQPVLEVLENCLKDGLPTVLLGEPGAGKTTALEALAYRLARSAYRCDITVWTILTAVASLLFYFDWRLAAAWIASFSIWEILRHRAVVPLFIEARSEYGGGDVSEWREKILKDSLGEKPLLTSRNQHAFLVDGMNEVQASLHGAFVEGWRGLLQPTRGPKHPVRAVFTSRIGEDPSPILRPETLATICELDDSAVREFLRIYESRKAADARSQYVPEQTNVEFEELKSKGLLKSRGIGRNPYWLRMIVESGLYTRNRGVLFLRFAEKLIQREIAEKPEGRKRNPNWRIVPLEIEMEALGKLALAMHEAHRIGFADEAGWDAGRTAIRNSLRDLPYLPDDVLGEAEAATLVSMEPTKRVEFVHQLVQEFFVAYALRRQETHVLARLQDPHWWPPLLMLGALLLDHHSLVNAVLRDGERSLRVFLAAALLGVVEEPSVESRRAVISALQSELSFQVTERQEIAVEVLSRIAGDELADSFAAAFDEAENIRPAVVKLLGHIKTKRSCEILLRLLRTREGNFVADALAQMPDLAVQPLIELLHDPDDDLRASSTRALSKIRDKRSVEFLIPLLQEKAYGVKSGAAIALGEIRDARAVEPLISVLHGADRDLYHHARHALGKIGAPAVEPLVAVLNDGDASFRWRAAQALGETRDDRAVQPVLVAIRSDSKNLVDMKSVQLWTNLEKTWWALKIMQEGLSHYADNTSGTAAKILGLARDPEAVELLGWAFSHGPYLVRAYAAEALGEIGDRRALSILAAALRDDYPVVRGMAAAALARMGDRRALAILRESLDEKHSVVKEMVLQAIRDIEAYSEN
jgi:HEAT repeat protein